MEDNDNDNGLKCEHISFNTTNNDVIIDFNFNATQSIESESFIEKDNKNKSKRKEKGKAITKEKANAKVNNINPNIKTSKNNSINSNLNKSEQIKNNNSSANDNTDNNKIESKSVQFNYVPSTPNTERKENSIVKTENGYEIYFVENSVSKRNKTISHKDNPNANDDITVLEDINTQELISQNYGLKEAMNNNEDTYNSLEREFMFNTNNNNHNPYSSNSNYINGDNNNQLLLNLSNTSKNNRNSNNFFASISHNNILNENSIHFNNNNEREATNVNNHIIINFNNYNYQFSGLEVDNSNVKRYNSNNLSLEDLSLYSRQNSKLIKKKIFQNNPVCNLSNRLVNDENNILNKSHLANNSNNISSNNSNSNCNSNNYNCFKYKFIDNVKQNAYINRMNKIKTMIPMTQFLLLKKNIMLNIIHYAYDDIEEIKSSFESIKNKINATLSSYYYPIVEQFNNAYSNDLELYEYYFSTNKKRSSFEPLNLISSNIFNRKYQPKTKYVSLDLYIKAKIISSQINQTNSLSLLFHDSKTAKSNRKVSDQMILTWKYVLVNRNDINVWIASEAEDYDGRISRFCYIQPVILYSVGDFISIKLPILFKDNSLDQSSIQWVPMTRIGYSPEKSNCLFFEKSVYHNTHASLMKIYDKIRFCELETLIHLWKSEKSLTNRKIGDEVRKLLLIGDVFNELSFEFDVRRVYIFKVKLKAAKLGCVKRNRFINFDIVIKEAVGLISNETQCLGLLNSINSQFEMRIGEIMLFYFTEIGG